MHPVFCCVTGTRLCTSVVWPRWNFQRKNMRVNVNFEIWTMHLGAWVDVNTIIIDSNSWHMLGMFERNLKPAALTEAPQFLKNCSNGSVACPILIFADNHWNSHHTTTCNKKQVYLGLCTLQLVILVGRFDQMWDHLSWSKLAWIYKPTLCHFETNKLAEKQSSVKLEQTNCMHQNFGWNSFYTKQSMPW